MNDPKHPSDTLPLEAIAPTRRRALQMAGAVGLALGGAGTLPALAAGSTTSPASNGKVLRMALPVAETGFDPARVNDLYSNTIIGHILEGLYGYDHLARPVKIKPKLASGMPEMSADFKVFIVKLKPGIYFANDPAFKGQRREVVAEDFVYIFKRFADPATKSPLWGEVDDMGMVGLAAVREDALKNRKPFDYDRPVAGLRALDRHTLRIETTQPQPRLIERLANGASYGVMAREVVEFYGEDIVGHPVGTGPFRLAQWRRSSFIALERNPDYREVLYDGEPTADDKEGQALLAQFKGRRLPMVDRVELSVVEESQPRWLSFLNGQHNFMLGLPLDFVPIAYPGNKLAPNLAHMKLQAYRSLLPAISLTCFNMEDPVVGGYTPEKIALRRAINLSLDTPREINLLYRGQAIPAQTLNVPYTTGYDPHTKTEMSDYDPARAKALLDLYGYVDKDGDGWRETPDGKPLVLVKNSQPDQLSRLSDELWARSLKAVGLRAVFKSAKWPENLKAVQAGQYQIWDVGSTATQLDGQDALARLYGPRKGADNLARFQNDQLNTAFARMASLPNGPEREKLFNLVNRIGIAFAPYKYHLYRYNIDMAYPSLLGYRRPLFWRDWWQFVDINPTLDPTPRG